VAMKECGHSFCDECAKSCLRTKKCPNCRVEVTGLIPNYFATESVGSMMVRCPQGQIEEDGSGQR
jgi:hypothetical protein